MQGCVKSKAHNAFRQKVGVFGNEAKCHRTLEPDGHHSREHYMFMHANVANDVSNNTNASNASPNDSSSFHSKNEKVRQ
jgi:hypothetical protein